VNSNLKNKFLYWIVRVFLGQESIEIENASLIQGRGGNIEAKMKKFGFSPENQRSKSFYRRGIDCTYSRTMKAALTLIQGSVIIQYTYPLP
jgi:hypothetical protein